MPSMIERVARVLVEADLTTEFGDYPEKQQQIEMHWQSWEDAARAAIEAMREPSPAMQQAVAAQWGRRTWSQYNDVIDAALKEQP